MSTRDVAVLGVGHSDFGELEGERVADFGSRATREAILNSNIVPDNIEEAYVGNTGDISQEQTCIVGQGILREVGVTGIPITRVENACSSSTCSFREAYQSVRHGDNDIVLSLGVDKMTGVSTETAFRAMAGGSDSEVEGKMGLTFMGVYGMWANAYMDKFGDIRDEMAEIAVKNHNNGLKNPHAHLKMEVTKEDVLNSRMISDPIRLLDACPISDGAAAAVLTTGENAEKLVDDPVYVDAAELGTGEYIEDDEYWRASIDNRVSERAYAAAGIGPDDLDVVEVHDAASVGELLRCEGIGLANHGEGPSLVRNGDIMLDGRIPVNPSGGLISRGHPLGATGQAQINEIVWQLRGEAGKRQVSDADIGLVHNVGGAFLGKVGTTTIIILST